MSSSNGARATPEQMRRQHIFVVNGSAEFLDVVRDLLQDEHYNVTTTNFVPLTFKQIETARPSLLIVDLIHGERAGWDLLAELRREAATRDVPVILVSTSNQLLEKAETERVIWGGDRFFLKPFSLEALLQAIQELVGPGLNPVQLIAGQPQRPAPSPVRVTERARASTRPGAVGWRMDQILRRSRGASWSSQTCRVG